MSVIITSSDKCRKCYACVRACPVKALVVSSGVVHVNDDKCIGCGSCVRACHMGAKSISDQTDAAREFLASSGCAALVAPSFAAAFPKSDPLKVIGALHSLGFESVWEVSYGAELLLPLYRERIASSNGQTMIGSMCPSVVALVERHHPNLTKLLMPLVSPMVATSIAARRRGAKRAIFIGPCPAKKLEVLSSQASGPDLAITFSELAWLLAQSGIDLDACEPSRPDFMALGPGRSLSLPSGLFRGLDMREDRSSPGVLLAEGSEACREALDAIESGEVRASFMEMAFCHGCVDGVGYPEDNHSVWVRREAVSRYARAASGIEDQAKCVGNDLSPVDGRDLERTFKLVPDDAPVPTEEEIRAVLAQTGKLSPDDELDCGACGFSSCREKAMAVVRGYADVDMCLPYLLNKKSMEVTRVQALADELDGIVNSSYDALYVCDDQGIIARANPACRDMMGLQVSDGLGMDVRKLDGLLFPDITMQALSKKKRVTEVRDGFKGRRLLVTATPVADSEGSVRRVVTTIRDFTEFIGARRIRPDAESFLTSAESEDLVAYSPAMEQVLTLVRKIADVNSTVLVTGESGVGKEVVARYIHRTGPRAQGPFVKINCGAIPETLLESELFGYDEGAFTGARKEGKPGLVQLASGGTLFLDEISEIPMGLQVKLLQVLQEKRLVKVGGTRQIQVDARIIAATNRDLEQAVKDGKFRADLYYRLNVIPVRVPPLRERVGDIIPLTYYFMDKYGCRYGRKHEISRSARETLERYSWPGNVRELQNVIEYLTVTVDDPVIGVEHLTGAVLRGQEQDSAEVYVSGLITLKDAVEEVERQLISIASHSCSSTYSIARVLGVNQSTIVRKMQKYGLTGDAADSHDVGTSHDTGLGRVRRQEPPR